MNSLAPPLRALFALFALFALAATVVSAQDVNAGRVAYTTPQVSGMESCSGSTCHTLNPLSNQNRILKAADNPGAIGQAINTYARMTFLKGKLSQTQFADLAAYIANPSAATGSPSAALSPASLTFASTVVGASAAAQTFAINNTGTAELLVSGVSSSIPDFSIVNSCASVAVGASCDVSVGFTPTVAGARVATITVVHNATGGSSTMSVSGAATPAAPVAQLSPTALTFASTIVGNNAAPQTFAISNVGTAALLVSAVTSSNTDFSIVHNCAGIAAGAGCNVSVGFTPSAAGARSGTITVTHNATGGATTLHISGVAAAPVPLVAGIQVTPASISFDPTVVGSFSGAVFVTVSSNGTAPLTISQLSIADANFPPDGTSCPIGAAIPVGTTCTIQLRFQPLASGMHTGMLRIVHDANATPTVVNLAGVGVAGATSNLKTMVEYLYVPLNYFFITSRDSDKLLLDTVATFQRTGQSFPVLATQTGDAKAITRFYFDKVAVQGARGSHFYSLLDEEKTLLAALNPNNATTAGLPLDEGIDSWAFLPSVTGSGGSCASGQRPVFRLFRGNTRFPDDANHRFTVSTAIYNEYVALGWDGEGVRFCVPSQ